jgi:hypothetical protein
MKTYKEFLKQFEEEITNNVGQIPAASKDANTLLFRQKGDRKNKRKDNVEILRRLLPKKS